MAEVGSPELDQDPPEIVLTRAGNALFTVIIRRMVDATRGCRPECAKAKNAPRRIAGGVLKYSILQRGADPRAVVLPSIPRRRGQPDIGNLRAGLSPDGAKHIAACFRACPGLLNGMCRYSPVLPESAEADGSQEPTEPKTLEELQAVMRGLIVRKTMLDAIQLEAARRSATAADAQKGFWEEVYRVKHAMLALQGPEQAPSTND